MDLNLVDSLSETVWCVDSKVWILINLTTTNYRDYIDICYCMYERNNVFRVEPGQAVHDSLFLEYDFESNTYKFILEVNDDTREDCGLDFISCEVNLSNEEKSLVEDLIASKL